MNKLVINTVEAPAAIGPYSQAIVANGTVYCSGMIAINPLDGMLIVSDIRAETHQVMRNISNLLHAASSSLQQAVKCTIFMRDMNDYTAINEVYASYFHNAPPAREAVQVSRLPKDVNVEISVIALIK